MTDRKTGVVKDIWLHICKEGGRWTPEEIAQELGLPRESARVVMTSMQRRQGALTVTKNSNRLSFGVTADCKVPMGVTVRDLAGVGVIPQESA